jgi:hypothetical protein
MRGTGPSARGRRFLAWPAMPLRKLLLTLPAAAPATALTGSASAQAKCANATTAPTNANVAAVRIGERVGRVHLSLRTGAGRHFDITSALGSEGRWR